MNTLTNMITVKSPTDGSVIGEVPVSSPQEIADAIARSERAFQEWKQTSISERVSILRNLRRIILSERQAMIDLVALEQGKPKTEALIVEISPVLETLAFLIHDAPKILSPRRSTPKGPYLRGRSSTLYFHPYGIWTVISPWNYPINTPIVQLCAILFAGNTAILKPSPLTPLCGQWLVDAMHRAGFPKEVVQVVQGGATEGEMLLSDPMVRAVLVTGSVATGRRVMEVAAQTNKKVVLELGGKDPAIVLSDADLERSAKGVVWAGMMNAGQTCAAIERVYVEQAVYEPFAQLLKKEIEALRVGNPLKGDPDMGPVVAPFQIEKIDAHVQDAIAKGARLLCGGKRLMDLGELYYAPTLLTDVNHDMQIMREETFGPVLAVQAFQSEEEAIQKANDSAYGLTASIWTRSRERAQRMAPRLECGAVTVNSHMTSFSDGCGCWGGFKDTGIGRTHGEFGLYELVQTQHVQENYVAKPEIWWYPYSERVRQITDDLYALIAEQRLGKRLALMKRFSAQTGYLNRFMTSHKTMPGLLRYLK